MDLSNLRECGYAYALEFVSDFSPENVLCSQLNGDGVDRLSIPIVRDKTL